MKKVNYFLALMAVVASIGFTSCSKDNDGGKKGSTPDRFVNIDDPQDIQDALQIGNAQVVKGDLPESTPGNYNLSSSISSIKVNSGGSVILPFIYSGEYTIKTVYIQVIGANGYFSVTPILVVGTQGYAYISINIPKKIGDGSFYVHYLILDSSGSYSNVVISEIFITNDVIDCENAYNYGEQGLTFTPVNLGSKSGEVSIYYDTYSVPDRIDIYQGNTWITGTGENPNSLIPPMCDCDNVLPGFIGDYGNLTFNYDASKGQVITVVVSGCLNGGTAWEWRLVKSPGCNFDENYY